MTGRIHSLTVVLDRDLRDAEELIAAIGLMRGVIKVTGNVSDPLVHVAEERARLKLAEKLWSVLHPDSRKS